MFVALIADGLAVIAAHGPEVVDAAFLTPQLAAAADVLAAPFADDASLAEWFAAERARVVRR